MEMISWEYFRAVRKLKLEAWLSNTGIHTYEDLSSVLYALGVKTPTRAVWENELRPFAPVVWTPPSAVKNVSTKPPTISATPVEVEPPTAEVEKTISPSTKRVRRKKEVFDADKES